MDPAGITELERGLVLVEQVIRHSVVRLGDDETPIAKESKAETVVESAEPTAE
jgi:ribosomal protein S6